MYAIELTQPSPSFDQFRRVTLAPPALGRGDLRIRQRAASLNFIDLAVANGGYPAPRFPLVPVSDGAGEVVEVGAEVEGFAVGDRVIVHAKPAWSGGPIDAATSAIMRGLSLPGALAEYAVVAASAAVACPEHLDFAAAATLPIAATTAWNALQRARIRLGAWVVVLGTGGVSLFALQLAKASGARVIVTSSSDAKLERTRALGADVGINYRSQPAWARAVLDHTGGRGADLVVETGGAETFAQSLDAAAPGGTVFTIGFLTGTRAAIDVLPIVTKALRVQGNNTGSVADLRDAVRAVTAARIVPIVDRAFGLDEVSTAYQRAAAGAQLGKIVIQHDA